MAPLLPLTRQTLAIHVLVSADFRLRVLIESQISPRTIGIFLDWLRSHCLHRSCLKLRNHRSSTISARRRGISSLHGRHPVTGAVRHTSQPEAGRGFLFTMRGRRAHAIFAIAQAPKGIVCAGRWQAEDAGGPFPSSVMQALRGVLQDWAELDEDWTSVPPITRPVPNPVA